MYIYTHIYMHVYIYICIYVYIHTLRTMSHLLFLLLLLRFGILLRGLAAAGATARCRTYPNAVRTARPKLYAARRAPHVIRSRPRETRHDAELNLSEPIVRRFPVRLLLRTQARRRLPVAASIASKVETSTRITLMHAHARALSRRFRQHAQRSHQVATRRQNSSHRLQPVAAVSRPARYSTQNGTTPQHMARQRPLRTAPRGLLGDGKRSRCRCWPGVSPVPVQMLAGGEPSPAADAGRG